MKMKKNIKSKLIVTLAVAALTTLETQTAQAALAYVFGAQNTDGMYLASSTTVTKLPVAVGSVALLGFYSLPVTSSTFNSYTSASQFLQNFTQLGATTVGGTGVGGEAGLFSGGATISNATGDAYIGKQLFYIVGNASTVAASTQMGVFTKNSGTWIIPTNPTAVTPVTVTTDINQVAKNSSGILFGSILTGGGEYGDAFKLATVNAIPEPSSASLLALGVAGLVALRVRRKS
jgi:hypothetical protein